MLPGAILPVRRPQALTVPNTGSCLTVSLSGHIGYKGHYDRLPLCVGGTAVPKACRANRAQGEGLRKGRIVEGHGDLPRQLLKKKKGFINIFH